MSKIKALKFPASSKLSNTEKLIINSRERKNGKITVSIPTVETISDLYNASIPIVGSSFDSFIEKLQRKAEDNVKIANTYLKTINDKNIISKPTSSAFNNCNGSWTEYGFAVYAWNTLVDINKANKTKGNSTVYIYVKLPNRNSEMNDWSQLLKANIKQDLDTYLTRQSKKIKDTTSFNYQRSFEISSSNPDAVILKYDSITISTILANSTIKSIDPYKEIAVLNNNIIDELNSLFTILKGSVLPSANLQSFLSIKRSTRPDRRYQWIREGEHIKTLLLWIIVTNNYSSNQPDSNLDYDDLNGKFFAISTEHVTTEDKNAMDIGLGGSITDNARNPVWSVDKLYECLTFADVSSVIKEILSFH